VRFRFEPEHDALRSSLRRLLDKYVVGAGGGQPEGDLKETDPDLLRRLADEVGVFALAVPERFGGAGFGLLELGVVFEEAGRSLLGAPLLATTAAAQLLVASGDEAACRHHLPGLAAGELIATVALTEDDPNEPAAHATTATRSGDSWTITGSKRAVLDVDSASALIVSAAAPEGTSLFTVDPTGPGVELVATPSVDLTRRLYDVRLSQAPAAVVGEVGAAETAIMRTLDVLRTLLAAEQVGITRACLDMAAEWAKEREQFGRTIGSFQAIKHKLANVALEHEAAVSAELMALFTADNSPADLPAVARTAAYICGEAALLAAQENIQVHGGMGATWEHSAHFYLRRAHLDRQLLGSPQQHLEALAVHAETSVPALI